MSNQNKRCQRSIIESATYFLLIMTGSALAAPSIQQVSGPFKHKASVTLTGSGYGNKLSAPPAVWDDASGNNILEKWDGFWPNCSGNTKYNVAYRTPSEVGRNISLPHTHITKYISGAHYPSSGADCGYNVMFWKNRNISFPGYLYLSYYFRADDNWTFGSNENFKIFEYSQGNEPYNLSANWYLEYNQAPTSRLSDVAFHINQNGNLIDGTGEWGAKGINPMSGRWIKMEHEIKYSSGMDGFARLYENGVLKQNWQGITEPNYAGNVRSESVGGYTRSSGNASNWRYYADVYMDYTLARVVLANNADLAKATIIETQVPSSWTNNSITLTANLGQFASGDPGYLFVFDSSGQHNTAGFPVSINSGTNPQAPDGLVIVK